MSRLESINELPPRVARVAATALWPPTAVMIGLGSIGGFAEPLEFLGTWLLIPAMVFASNSWRRWDQVAAGHSKG